MLQNIIGQALIYKCKVQVSDYIKSLKDKKLK
jgi:hypothetical protein